ncbi:hypothetical protein OJAV_G00069510 [Oryzias javanicus]|uniref:CHHC U11-48K-type domain-containing protein n=1 Tax=Oryzias javanicus TaxID=123683 RepID=A0A437D894_ORYJA|nr:hypothetical protein OJAV_G00069510 [Oryzias javanicus]
MDTTITFGSASSSCRAVDEERPQLPVVNGEKGNCDPEKLLLCPFDKNHLIRACRFPYHLIKCRKNHPKLAGELKTCPFNARHLIPQHELARHTETCVDRVTVDPKAESTDYCSAWEVPVTAWVNPVMSEDWDKEIENNVTSFVWGANLVLRQTKEAKSSKHDLSFRAPNTLPWGFFDY